MLQPRFLSLVCVVFFAASLRVLPHPHNFTPIVALALFASAYFARGWIALAVALSALLVSNVVLGYYFHPVHLFVYGSVIAAVLAGRLLLQQRTVLRILGTTVTCSLIFFVLTNFGFWLTGTTYPRTLDGLMACYVRAVPFYRFTLLGDVFYVSIFFGGFAWATHYLPMLREPRGTDLRSMTT